MLGQAQPEVSSLLEAVADHALHPLQDAALQDLSAVKPLQNPSSLPQGTLAFLPHKCPGLVLVALLFS